MDFLNTPVTYGSVLILLVLYGLGGLAFDYRRRRNRVDPERQAEAMRRVRED